MCIQMLFVVKRENMEKYKQMIKNNFSPEVFKVMRDEIIAYNDLFLIRVFPADSFGLGKRGYKFDKIFVETDCIDEQTESDLLMGMFSQHRISHI